MINKLAAAGMLEALPKVTGRLRRPEFCRFWLRRDQNK